jgi:hypothetical protein
MSDPGKDKARVEGSDAPSSKIGERLICDSSSDLTHDLDGSAQVALSVDLRHVGLGVPEDDLRGLLSESCPDRRRCRVAELQG